MAIEIERRFLIKGEKWKSHIVGFQTIRQGYLSTNFEEWVVRIRIIDSQKAFIGLKRSIEGMLNEEFEYSIPIREAESIWETVKQRVTKTRYCLNIYPGSWVIDCFSGKNDHLVIGEIELERADAKFDKPDWCCKEITKVKSLTNAALAKCPISKWEIEEKEYLNLH